MYDNGKKQRFFLKNFQIHMLSCLETEGFMLDNRQMFHTFQWISAYCSQMHLDYIVKNSSLGRKVVCLAVQ